MKALNRFIYIFVALLPFQFALNIAPGFDLSVIRVVVLFLFGVIILKSFFKKDFFVSLNLQSAGLFLFLMINFFSMFFTKNMEFSLRKILFLVSILPLYFVIMDIHRDNSDKAFIFRVVEWMVWGGAISFFVGIIIFLCQFVWGIDFMVGFYQKIGSFFWGNTFTHSIFENQSFLVNIGGNNFLRMFSFFPDPHNFALFAGMIFFLSGSMFLYCLEMQINKRKTVFYAIVSLIGAVSVFLSFSRGAYLALLGGIFVVAVLLFKKKISDKKNIKIERSKAMRYRKVANLFFIVFFLAIVFFSPIKSRFIDIFSLSDGSNVGRIQIMRSGLSIFKEHFLFGVGIGNAPLYYNEDVDYRSPINSHNNYLEIAIENGFLGLLIWSVLIFGTIFLCIEYFKKEKDGWNRYLSLGTIGGMIVFSIHSFFEVFIYSPINLSVLMVLLAISSSILGQKNYK